MSGYAACSAHVRLWLGLLALAVTTALVGCGSVSAPGGRASSRAVPTGRVTVTVMGVPAPAGSQLAGVLSTGDSRDAVWWWDPVGGFGVSGPGRTGRFSTSQSVRVPDPGWRSSSGLFPYVLPRPLGVPVGTYTLYLWVGHRLGPWGLGWGWPGQSTFMRRTGRLTRVDKLHAFCETTFDVGADGATVTVVHIDRVRARSPAAACVTA